MWKKEREALTYERKSLEKRERGKRCKTTEENIEIKRRGN